ncbi:MAG: Rrf2 family transcriptional regulator [Solirubrobacterales bacterium]
MPREMRISAKADYAMRAVLELAAAEDPPVTREDIAEHQHIPSSFLEKILSELHRAGLVTSHRGTDGGYSLARPAEDIPLADVLRVIEGPLTMVRDQRPETLEYDGPAEGLTDAWLALRESMRTVLETTTVDDVMHQELPPAVAELIADDDSSSSS